MSDNLSIDVGNFDFPESSYNQIKTILIRARKHIAYAVNSEMIAAYWEIGKRVFEVTGERSRRNSGILRELAARLSAEFGSGFSETNLRKMRQFYQAFPKRDTLCLTISWSHYRRIMRCFDQAERDYYVKACSEEGWSVRELDRQINTKSYWRLRSTQKEQANQALWAKESGSDEAFGDSVFKDPYVLEFVGLDDSSLCKESDLEQALIDSLEKFLLELGRGFTFYGRQKRISMTDEDYYIDLVFYNYILNCFVLIDLKTHAITAGDVGQMDFYVRAFDGLYKPDSANPTVGIILGTEKSRTVARYTALADRDRLFAAQYMTELPTEEELQAVLDYNRRLLKEQQIRQQLDAVAAEGEDE